MKDIIQRFEKDFAGHILLEDGALKEWVLQFILSALSEVKAEYEISSKKIYDQEVARSCKVLKEQRGSWVGKIEGMRKKKIKHFGGFEDIKSEDYENTPFGCGFNQALSDVINLLKE